MAWHGHAQPPPAPARATDLATLAHATRALASALVRLKGAPDEIALALRLAESVARGTAPDDEDDEPER